MGDELQDLKDLKERLSKRSDEELIAMVTTGANDYRQEALDYAKAELKYRRVDIPQTPGETADEPEEADETSDEPVEPNLAALHSTCMLCGGTLLRPASLFAEKELIIVFGDQEKRFVRVNVCTTCGLVSLFADYETEVES
jgi:hypothetical protein